MKTKIDLINRIALLLFGIFLVFGCNLVNRRSTPPSAPEPNLNRSPESDDYGLPRPERTSSEEWRAYAQAFSKFNEFSTLKRTRRVTETKTPTSSSDGAAAFSVYITEFDGAHGLRQIIDGQPVTIIVGKKKYSEWHGKWAESYNTVWRFYVLDDLMRDLTDVRPLGQETLNGVQYAVYETRYVKGYRGKVWIGIANGLPHLLDANQPAAKWHIVFEYDVPIQIAKPKLG